MANGLMDDNVNGVPFPDFIPTGKKIVIKAIETSCAYATKSQGGIYLPTGKDESAFFKAEIIEIGPDCDEWVEECRYIHVYAAGGTRGAKPISLANGHFCCEQDDIWFWEPMTEENAPVDEESGKLIQLVTE